MESPPAFAVVLTACRLQNPGASLPHSLPRSTAYAGMHRLFIDSVLVIRDFPLDLGAHLIDESSSMTFSNSALFNKTNEQCRLVGARGGRARARNLRLRHASRTATPPPEPPEPEEDIETAHEASTLLDERFPHLRDAFAPRRTTRDRLIQLLRQPGGASTDEMVSALGMDRKYVCRSFRSIAGPEVRISRLVRADGNRAYVVQ